MKHVHPPGLPPNEEVMLSYIDRRIDSACEFFELIYRDIRQRQDRLMFSLIGGLFAVVVTLLTALFMLLS